MLIPHAGCITGMWDLGGEVILPVCGRASHTLPELWDDLQEGVIGKDEVYRSFQNSPVQSPLVAPEFHLLFFRLRAIMPNITRYHG